MVDGVTVAVWAIVALLALGAASAPLPSLGAQALMALGGLGTAIAFVAGGAQAFAWVSVGLACLIAVIASVAARGMINDPPDAILTVHQPRKELAAGLLGFELPLVASVIPLGIGMAVA